jgi:catechol 2,3-dioxygenase-like lactoylglutathione lyase family enzyme
MLRIKLAAIFVDDQDKALRFYTDVLGFEKSQDIPVGGPYRWITVRSAARDGAELSLEPDANPAARTYQQALLAQGIPATAFEVDDIHAEYERLRGLGVEFKAAPAKMGTVVQAVLLDTCGNLIMLYEPPPQS